MTIRFLCCLLVVCVAGLSACSFSRSSSSPFRWSSQSSKSSSASSGGAAEQADQQADKEQSQFERDVEQTTAQVVQGGGGASEILRRVGDVALQHNVSDWEDEPGSFEAMGRGLKGVAVDRFELLTEQLAGTSEVRKRLLQQGYTGSQ